MGSLRCQCTDTSLYLHNFRCSILEEWGNLKFRAQERRTSWILLMQPPWDVRRWCEGLCEWCRCLWCPWHEACSDSESDISQDIWDILKRVCAEFVLGHISLFYQLQMELNKSFCPFFLPSGDYDGGDYGHGGYGAHGGRGLCLCLSLPRILQIVCIPSRVEVFCVTFGCHEMNTGSQSYGMG